MDGENVPEGFDIIPRGELKCIWMEEGVVSFKICSRNLECEDCPLDKALRGGRDACDAGGVRGDSALAPLIDHFSRFKVNTRWFYHPGHTWVQVESPDRARVGLDDFILTILGTIDGVALPRIGDAVTRGRPFAEILQGPRCFSVLSPLCGRVEEANAKMTPSSCAMAQNPSGEGWLVAVKPDRLEEDLSHSRTSKAVFPWYIKAVERVNRVIASLFGGPESPLGRTLHDGGLVSRDLKDLLPPETYRRFILDLLWGENEAFPGADGADSRRAGDLR